MTPPRFTDALKTLIPPPADDETSWRTAISAIAELVLNRTIWHMGGVAHRFTEVEFYVNGPKHGDTFTHGDPMQREFGRWYHHRTAGEFRGGTYKGLDIAFGREDTFAGILIRGIEALEGDRALYDGPCLCVDHLLELTHHADVASIAASFDRLVDKPARGDSPSYLTVENTSRGKTVFATPRVGLSLKRGASEPRVRFIAAPYRFLTEPARIKKGRPHLVCSLHAKGKTPTEITQITGSKPAQVAAFLTQYEAGRGRDVKEFRKDLSTDEMCQLFGACESLLKD
jgi:3-methyladenine DNA glycosylase Mpg